MRTLRTSGIRPRIRSVIEKVTDRRISSIALGFSLLGAVNFASTNALAQTNVDFGPAETFADSGNLSVTLNVGSTITGDATLSLTDIFGDLNFSTETVTVRADGVLVGTFGNFGGSDCVARPNQNFTIPGATILPLIADNTLLLTFETSADVDVCDPGQPNLRLSGNISYLGAQQSVTTITSDPPDPSVIGQDYTVNVTVSPGIAATGTPTGTVSVDDGDGGVCSITLSGGSGSCVIAGGSPLGASTITANYSGGLNFLPSSDTEAHTVIQGATTTTITSDNPDPSDFNQPYQVFVTVAAVAPAVGTPTGNVNVDDGNGNTCTVILAAGNGSCQLNNTPVGGATITATYVGDSNFTGSSDTEAHTVQQAPTTTTITADTPDPSVFGFAYTVDVTVASTNGTPTGTVTVDDGAGNMCNINLVAGMGSCMINNTPVGLATLTATYNGDVNFSTSNDTEPHTVNATMGTITIVKNTAPAIAGDGLFTYTSADPVLNAIEIRTTGNAGSSGPITRVGDTYVVTEDVIVGWRLQSISCVGDLDNGTVINTATRSVSIDLDHLENIVCTFVSVRDEEFVRERTQRVIANFINRRADQITASEPDIVERLSRRTVTSDIAGSLNLLASGDEDNTTLSFSTSLRQIVGAEQSRRAAIQNSLMQSMALGPKTFKSEVVTLPQEETTGLDIWVQGKVSHITEATRQSDLGLLYIGADYHVSPGFVIGVLGQFDWADQEDVNQQTEVDGFGWLVGPYMVARLSQNLYFDARGAYGESNNDVNPLGTYTDSFDTTRWLAKGQLTGDFKMGNWRFSPHAAVIYFEEEQQSYQDSLGFVIPSQTESLGRVTFGPKIGYAHETVSGTIIHPHVAIKGIWDFDAAETFNLTTGLTEGSTEDVRARVNAGVAARFTGGWKVTGEGFFDGIGTKDLESYGGSLKVNMPLN